MDGCAEHRKLLAAEFAMYRKVFSALGDETRQQIFTVLLENDTVGMRVPEITARTHLSRPAVSHHLQILKDAGLVNMHRVGTMNFYYVDTEERFWDGLKELVDHLNDAVHAANKNGYPNFEEDW